jgi:hypothetical protein
MIESLQYASADSRERGLLFFVRPLSAPDAMEAHPRERPLWGALGNLRTDVDCSGTELPHFRVASLPFFGKRTVSGAFLGPSALRAVGG